MERSDIIEASTLIERMLSHAGIKYEICEDRNCKKRKILNLVDPSLKYSSMWFEYPNRNNSEKNRIYLEMEKDEDINLLGGLIIESLRQFKITRIKGRPSEHMEEIEDVLVIPEFESLNELHMKLDLMGY